MAPFQLWEMSPGFPADDPADIAVACVELPGELFQGDPASLVSRTYGHDRLVGELGVSVWPVSLLSDHVRHVVAVRPEKQMGRINARPVVAVVENPKAVRDRADEKLIGDSMRVKDLAASARPDLPVTAVSQSAGPGDATRRRLLANVAKKPVDQRYELIPVGAGAGTTGSAAPGLSGCDRKLLTARWANERGLCTCGLWHDNLPVEGCCVGVGRRVASADPLTL